MRYCPVSSVTPVRTLVMSAGLDASMVTPGSTAPEVSRTVPARLCAVARLGTTKRLAITSSSRISSRFMSENLHNRLVTRGGPGRGMPRRLRGLWTVRPRLSRKDRRRRQGNTCSRDEPGDGVTALFASLGRMALTNYLTESVVLGVNILWLWRALTDGRWQRMRGSKSAI